MNIDFPILEGSATIEYIDELIEHLKVGNISFKIYNSYHLSLNGLRYSADSVSADDIFLMDSFIDEYEDELDFGLKFLTLDRIKIEPEYRNNGLGSQAILELKKVCEILDIQYIINVKAIQHRMASKTLFFY